MNWDERHVTGGLLGVGHESGEAAGAVYCGGRWYLHRRPRTRRKAITSWEWAAPAATRSITLIAKLRGGHTTVNARWSERLIPTRLVTSVVMPSGHSDRGPQIWTLAAVRPLDQGGVRDRSLQAEVERVPEAASE